MAIEPRFRRNSLLYLAAVLFAAITVFYAIVWVHYLPKSGTVRIGLEFIYSLPSRHLRVARVIQGSNAEKAGLRPGDEVLAINGKTLDTLTPYYDFIVSGSPGESVEILVLRPGEKSPRPVTLALESVLRIDMFRALNPARLIALQVMRSYPVLFLAVGLAVLFLKVEDPNAWLLALFFAGFVGIPDIPAGIYPASLRGFAAAFHVVLGGMVPFVLYYFLAIFPARSPLERRLPWVKWAILVSARICKRRNLNSRRRGAMW